MGRTIVNKFILLTPVEPSFYKLTTEQFIQITKDEYGCNVLISATKEKSYLYITSTTKEALERLVSENDLEGIVLEYSGVYDQVVE